MNLLKIALIFLLSNSSLPSNLVVNNKINISSNLDNTVLINKNSRVLHIGDSHTVGIYGKTIDALLRTTGAKVTTVGSSGSSPSWWIESKVTKSGFYMNDENGNIDSPIDWKTPHITPKLTDLIEKYHPNIIIFSLGANLIHQNKEKIESEVSQILEIAKKNKIKIIWVGPPNGKINIKPKEVQDFLYQHLKVIVKMYEGDFIDSRPYTYYPENMKGDGVHFGGVKGTKIAKDWSKQIFMQIQKISK